MKRKDLIKEPVSNVGNIIYSNDKPVKASNEEISRYVVSFDNLRLIVTSLPSQHEMYSEHSFEYTGKHYNVGPLSGEAEDLLEMIKEDPIFYLRKGTYKADKVHLKR